MLIDKIDRKINSLLNSESTPKRVIVSRIVTVASTALVALEAALRTIFSVITFTAYVISEPFFLAFTSLKLLADDEYKLNDFRNQQEYYANLMIVNPLVKAATSTLNIITTPLVGVLSPKAAIQMHVDCGLTDEDILRPIEHPNPINVENFEPISPDEFIGMDDVIERFNDHLSFLRNPEQFKSNGILSLPAGILLMGPPGCGKTYAAERLPRYASSQGITMAYMAFSVGDINSKWAGETLTKLRQKFVDAQKITATRKIPLILFIDECDSLMSERGNNMDSSHNKDLNALVGEFLIQLEAAPKRNIIVVCSTNKINNLDPAIKRTGRIDYVIPIASPSSNRLFQVVQKRLEKVVNKDKDIELEALIFEMEGISLSDVESIFRSAIIKSINEQRPLSQRDLSVAINRVKEENQIRAHKPPSRPLLNNENNSLKARLDLLSPIFGT